MSQNKQQVKVIQSRLTRKEVAMTTNEIKAYLTQTRPGVVDFEPEELSAIVNELSGSQMVTVGANELGEIPNKTETEPTESALSVPQKQELVSQVAATLDIKLSVEQVQEISQKMNWALSDRTLMKERIKSAIVAWIDYQVNQDIQQTDEMMQEVEGHLVTRLQESNKHFQNKSAAFSGRIGEAVEQFRATETTILNLFQVPS